MKIKKHKMKNKKGFLLAEYTLKMVIAGIALMLLIYLLFSLYSSFTDKKNFDRAKATLDSLIEKMDDVKEHGKSSLPLLEPNGWILISYTKTEKPDVCNKNCICLCASPSLMKDTFGIGDSQVERCNIRGVCKDIDYLVNDFNIELRTDVDIDFKDGGFLIIGNENVETEEAGGNQNE